ncbi:MAG TPA: HTTM domain-containing protein [Polyangiaceae bacterium]|nr:HTTM domain-containing protein [Polyangiaceae bacterium]
MKQKYELVPPPTVLVPAPAQGFAQQLTRLYAAADPRSLGLFRIALGALLLFDVALKLPEVSSHLSNSGWLSNHFALFHPMADHLFSVYFAFGSPLEVKVLMLGHLLVCVLLLVGCRTKLMQILALVLTTSLNSRNILIENGGSVVLNILLVWSVFLPLGRRFSIDALRASLRQRRETDAEALNDRLDPPREVAPVVSLAVTALLLQWATIYFFNTIHKHGPPWRDGTAVYYFLQQDRLVTWLGAWLRGVLPLGAIKALTYGTLVIEGAIPLLLLIPWRTHITRLVAFGLVVLLHFSIDAVLQLGSFSWAMVVVFCALLPTQAWAWALERVRARRAPCVVHFNPESGASLALCRLVKRLDALGLVTFRALDADSPKKAQKTLAVSVNGAKTVGGYQALLAVGDALWCRRVPFWLLGLPGIRKRVERRLAQLAVEPETLDTDFGTEALPRQGNARAPEPSRARLVGRKLAISFREAGVALMLVVCVTQVLIENEAVPQSLKPKGRPALLQAVIEYPRIFQGWSMFAPVPPQRDGRLVIDGRTKNGRSLDPLTGGPPVFELHPAGAPRMNLTWGYFHIRIVEDRFRGYWGGVRDFLMNHHELTGRPQDELSSFDAYYVTQELVPPGVTPPQPKKEKLFSSSNVASGDSGSPSGALPRSKTKRPGAQ